MTVEMVNSLGFVSGEDVVDILDQNAVTYGEVDGVVTISPMEFAVPEVYGEGTEPADTADLWAGQVMEGGEAWLDWTVAMCCD